MYIYIVFKRQLMTFSKRRCVKIGGESLIFLYCFSHGRRRNVFPLVVNCQYADKNQFVRRQPFDLDIETAHGQPAWCRARPTSEDDGLEDVRWVYGQGGERLPAASLCSSPKPENKDYFLPSERVRDMYVVIRFFAHQRPIVFLHHTPGERSPHITGHFANRVPLRWVGALTSAPR